MPKTIRCKFRCQSVTQTADGYSAHLFAVHSGSPENEEFFKWTPSGVLDLSLTKEQHFEPGKDYYLDITLAAEPEPVPQTAKGA